MPSDRPDDPAEQPPTPAANDGDEQPARGASPFRDPAPPPPSDPLAPAIAAMDGGDLREARRLAQAVAVESADTAARARALALLEQLAPDRTTIAVMGATGLLGALLALMYLGSRAG